MKSPKRKRKLNEQESEESSNDTSLVEEAKKTKRQQKVDQNSRVQKGGRANSKSPRVRNEKFETSFREGESMIKMGVDTEEEALYSDSDEETEVEFRDRGDQRQSQTSDEGRSKGSDEQIGSDSQPELAGQAEVTDEER